MNRILFFTGLITIAIAAVGCSSYREMAGSIDSFDQLRYRDPVSKVSLPESGFTIAYTDQGAGEKTIVFIHGLGSYLPAWNRNTAELARDYRCIAIDLPGYGKSDKQPHSGAMSFYAAIVDELVRELKLGKVYLAGHSMGGQIAIAACLLYPQIVEGLILAAPAGFEYFTKGQRQWFRDVMTLDITLNATPETIQNNLAVNFFRFPKEAEFMIGDRIAMRGAGDDMLAYSYAVSQSVKGMVDEPVLDYLGDIDVPVLILFGQNDNLIPNRYLNPGRTRAIAQAGHEKIAGSKLVMIPRCGHFLMFEKSGVFNSEVRNFLGD